MEGALPHRLPGARLALSSRSPHGWPRHGPALWLACLVHLAVLAQALGAEPLPSRREEFLRTDRVWDLHLELTTEAWRAMEPVEDGRPPGPGGTREYPWVTGRVEVAGVVFDKVGVRFKGNSSFNASRGGPRRPFKLDFDRHEPRRTLAGLEEVFLNNNANDPSNLRESLAYATFARAGVPAPRTTAARVTLTLLPGRTRQPLGLYTVVEPVEGDFLKHHFGTRKGLLVKPEGVRGLPVLGTTWAAHARRYEPKSTVSEADAARFVSILHKLDQTGDASFAEVARRTVDMDGFLRFLAVNAWLANYDSFLGNGHNYYLFLHPDGRLRFIPWDLNEAFGRHPMLGPGARQAAFSILQPHVPPNRFVERVLRVPEWARAYIHIVADLDLEGAACGEDILDVGWEALRRVRDREPALEPESWSPSPRRRPSPGFDETQEPGAWIRERRRLVRGELEGQRHAPQATHSWDPGRPGP